ncbi:lactate utilization protein [Arthrobacter sp. ISL-48]|uniref:lactate utilization protein n=1 Tax=Arthrobacter sp. ISL-48 TaxID=2819110 RepID=UPI001BE5477A|nr:lactate utilization protein [Arthrobacter sp. ISL-48]MBT2534109.1 lactate utilization protein [Arthrobacter sp. ISL-48]
MTSSFEPSTSPASAAASDFSKPADRTTLERVVEALTARGTDVRILSDRSEARAAVDQLIPDGTLVYTTTSRTLDELGISDDVRSATRYRTTRSYTETLDPATQMDEFRRHVSTMDVVIGSVHAVTEDGHVVIASASGSQLAPYAFGASHVIWVVGAQKIVKDLDEALARIEQYSLPLESERLQQVYGQPSIIGKQLVVSHERPGRNTMLLLEDAIGF